jgi:outer membrane protein assembly factor BamD (BamD/ComL family)
LAIIRSVQSKDIIWSHSYLNADSSRFNCVIFFGIALLLVRCGDKANDLYDTAQLEEKQNNKPHATKLYRQIVEEYPDSPHASQAKSRLSELEKAR